MNINTVDSRESNFYSSTGRGKQFDKLVEQENQSMRQRADQVDTTYGPAYTQEAFNNYARDLHKALSEIQSQPQELQPVDVANVMNNFCYNYLHELRT